MLGTDNRSSLSCRRLTFFFVFIRHCNFFDFIIITRAFSCNALINIICSLNVLFVLPSQLLSQDQNVGVKYEYSVPSASAPNEPESYSWTFTIFEKCSVSCGGGHQSRNVSCKSQRALEEVDPKLCDSSQKPAETQKCGSLDCPAQWVESEWGKCSAPCGQKGNRERKVHCEVIKADG